MKLQVLERVASVVGFSKTVCHNFITLNVHVPKQGTLGALKYCTSNRNFGGIYEEIRIIGGLFEGIQADSRYP